MVNMSGSFHRILWKEGWELVGRDQEGGAIFVGSSAITGARDGLHVESNL